MPKYLSALLILLLTSLASWAQQTTVHYDKPFYVAGEYVFFNFSNPHLPEDSLVSEVTILSDSRIIKQYFVQVFDKQGTGYFKSGYDLGSGSYGMEIRIFDDESGDPFVLFSGALDIFSGDQADPCFLTEFTIEPDRIHLEEELISLQNKTMDTNTTVVAVVDLSTVAIDSGHVISIAVREEDYQGKGSTIKVFPANPPQTSFLNRIPLFARRTMLEEEGISSKLVFGCDSRTFRFVLTQVDEDENFLMKIPSFVGEREIQFVDYVRRPFRISELPRTGLASVNPVNVEVGGVSHFVRDFNDRKQIYQLYSTVPQQVEFLPVEPDINDISPDYDLDVTDIDLRGRLLTVFKELSTPLKFRLQKDSTYQARVIYETADRKEFYSREAIFIVNGKITHDAHYVSQLPIQDVKHVKIYNELEKVREAFGPVGSGGIIDIEMIDPLYSVPNEIRLPAVRIEGLQAPLIYPVRLRQEEGIPLINPLLYWNPCAIVNSRGRCEIRFTTTDDRTNYEIEVVVRNNDGQLAVITKTFAVEPKGS